MSSDTLRSRIAHLLRKSQKAVYLYSHSVSSSSGSGEGDSHPRTSSRVNKRSKPRYTSRGIEAPPVEQEKKYSSVQVLVWKRVNEELSNSLRLLLRVQSQRELSHKALVLRDELYETWRRLESELHHKKGELESAVKGEQFVKATIYSEKLIMLKARVQAARAALNEFESAVGEVVASSSPEVSAFLEGNDGMSSRALRSEETNSGDDRLDAVEDEAKVLPFRGTRRTARS